MRNYAWGDMNGHSPLAAEPFQPPKLLVSDM